MADLLAEVGSYEEAIKERQKSGLLLGESPEEAGAVAAEFHEALRTGGPKGYWQENLELTLTRYRKSGAVYFPAITVAGAYAKAGDKENAFRWLEKSYQDREGQDITLLTSLPNFKNLRGDLRFADLLRRMRLPN